MKILKLTIIEHSPHHKSSSYLDFHIHPIQVSSPSIHKLWSTRAQ